MRVEIVLWPNPILTRGTSPLAAGDVDAEFRDTVERMAALMVDLRGVGLAAPQAGIAKRFMLVCPSGERGGEILMINPEIVARAGEDEMEEGCLSFPKVYGTIRRAEKIRAKYRDLDWVEREASFEGFPARIVQHELDHLNGIVFIDRMDGADLEANRARLAELKRAAAGAA
jgi:peptide deformylase